MTGGVGRDRVDYYYETRNVSVTLDGLANDGVGKSEKDLVALDMENIYGGSGNDNLVGNAERNYILGGPGNDTLSGLNGRDTLRGGDGNDVISGGNHEDSLFGEAGVDFLAGGKAADTLDGGLGSDVNGDNDPLDVLANMP